MASPNVVTLTDTNFKAEVEESSIPVLVDFWATWCGPCRAVAPTIEQLATEYQGKVKIAKLDIDTAPMITSKFGIQGVPTFIVFKNGQPVDKMVGAKPKGAFVTALSKVV